MSQSRSGSRSGSGVRSRGRGSDVSSPSTPTSQQPPVPRPRLDQPFMGQSTQQPSHEGCSRDSSVSLREILASEDRCATRPHLSPDRTNGALWFGRHPQIRQTIVSTFQSDFQGPWLSITRVPPTTLERWFCAFAQAFYWEECYHDKVYAAWKEVLANRHRDAIYRSGQSRNKPLWMSEGVWNLLLAHWDSDDAAEKSRTASANRRSRSVGDRAPATHTAGRRSFARVAMDIDTHHRSDGTYVDERVQQIEELVQSKIDDRVSQMDESTASTQLSTTEVNSLYLEVVHSDAKGRIYGVGTLASQLGGGETSAPAITHHVALTHEAEELKRSQERTAAELAEARAKIEEFEQHREKLHKLSETEARIVRFEKMMQRLTPFMPSIFDQYGSPTISRQPDDPEDASANLGDDTPVDP
ncbi:PREDICTED: uncharacterized protein LOC104803477 [Tarenaya hassleriana]|uniref:uncharacterized protein LOC104803477 n=1 Tax=Tarenaya hassleriana TaxID=28532 RepID=UPI00053C0D1A|nr:PREDICTED: uncharacterized protein LOC104803477 [Tarenaya hassleriana]